MEVKFTDLDGNEIMTVHGRNQFVPRQGERVFIDDNLYTVFKVFHWYTNRENEKPKMYTEIELVKQ